MLTLALRISEIPSWSTFLFCWLICGVVTNVLCSDSLNMDDRTTTNGFITLFWPFFLSTYILLKLSMAKEAISLYILRKTYSKGIFGTLKDSLKHTFEDKEKSNENKED